jgi:hypothetical protein
MLALLPLSLFAACRGCERTVSDVAPTASVRPAEVKFGKVKLGQQASAQFTLAATTRAALAVEPPTLGAGNLPGGAEGFSLGAAPATVAPLAEVSVPVTFLPTVEQGYEAVVSLRTNDPENPTVSVLLTGEGSLPHLVVTPQCDPTVARCIGLPPSPGTLALDFGPQPRRRASPVPANRLPSVALVNEGDVPLELRALRVEGPDASSFSLRGTTGTTLVLQGGEGVNVPVDFTPTSESQATYAAELVIESDDPSATVVRVGLMGSLRPNQPPVVCANVVQVKPGDGSLPLLYDTAADWAPLLISPPAGYDFTASRDVQPLSEVKLSALSSAEATVCSTDPEDERTGLQFRWSVVSVPSGSTVNLLSGAGTPVAVFRPTMTGDYQLQLTVTDSEGSATSTTLQLRVARKEDLVAQLSWGGEDGGFAGVDLDLHLVRPGSPPFSFFSEGAVAGAAGATSGDLNGYSATVGRNVTGFNFDWGQAGAADDPRLNVDDTGQGALVENVSLNDPEHAAECAAGPCAYGVWVHYFKDGRAPTGASACDVNSSCADGEACQCSAALACVANEAVAGGPISGAGRCFLPPQPVVRIYLRGRATPAAEIPLAPDAWQLGAPCQALHVADVLWPRAGAPDGGTALDGGSEPVVVPVGPGAAAANGRFGLRTAGDLACSPDLTLAAPNAPAGAVSWYGPQPL